MTSDLTPSWDIGKISKDNGLIFTMVEWILYVQFTNVRLLI